MKKRCYRVVRVGGQYYLQFREWFRWVFVCGYHRGAPGYYNYQYSESANPFFHVEYTIPEVEKQRRNPTLSRMGVLQSKSRVPRKPGPVEIVLDVDNIQEALQKYRQKVVDVTKPYPLLAGIESVG